MAEVFAIGAKLPPVHCFQCIAACRGADGPIELRSAQPMKKAPIHRAVTEHADGSGIRIGQDRFRPICVAYMPEARRNSIQRLIPRNALEGTNLLPLG